MPPRRQQQQQQHEQKLQELETLAGGLHKLLHSHPASQLLQQPPPAAALTPDQQHVVRYSDGFLTHIPSKCRELRAAAAAAGGSGRVLGRLLQQQASAM